MKALAVVVLLLSVAFVQAQDSTDQDWFGVLYQKVSDIVSPQVPVSADADNNVVIAAPHQLFLMETPGLAIAQEDFDPDVWKSNNYRDRSPSYVLAEFVDRAPRYTDVTFVDSGARVSQIWRVLMTQYLVPVIDDPVQVAAVEKARQTLYNSTLQEDFDEAFDTYAGAFTASLAARESCLENSANAILCTQSLLIPEMTLANSWYNMETRRRDLLGAQAAILALQMMDLKTLYAEALQKFSRSKRVDVGAESFGDEFYQTYATPSDFWKWWKKTPNRFSWAISRYGGSQKVYMNDVLSGDNLFDCCSYTQGDVDDLFSDVKTYWTISSPTLGSVTPHQTCLKYDTLTKEMVDATCAAPEQLSNGILPNGGFDIIPSGPGVDSFTLTYKIGTPEERVHTYTVSSEEEISGSAKAAFSKISWSQSEYLNTAGQSTSSLSTSVSARGGFGMFSASGSFNYGKQTASSSSSSVASSSQTAFSVAKVNINRPWLDTNLMTFKPVAIRGVSVNGWSVGPGFPKADNSRLRFPLLPTAFVVIRDLEFTASFSSEFAKASAVSTQMSASVKVSYGPFFSGKASVSTSNTNAKQSSGGKFSGSTLNIEGPQVIGWVCTILPAFPTASSQAMEKMNFGQVLTNTFTQVGAA